ncbi:MAG TPA: FtsX-like permease family protein [Candidatus Dormibacteraeota bacterium]
MIAFFGIPPQTLALAMGGAVAGLLLLLLGLAAVNRVLLKMALRNIPRRRAQTVLILFGLMLATLIITSSLAVGDTLAYSLQAIQVRQIGGIDEAVARYPDRSAQGASMEPEAFFSKTQAADVVARAKADPNVAAAGAVVVSPGSVLDTTTSQVAAENVAVFGVEADFDALWAGLRSSGGASLSVAALLPGEVYVGKQLGAQLNARPGDVLKLYVNGQPALVSVRDVLSTEVNPSIANHGPIVRSVLMPLATMRAVLQQPAGYNLVFLHNRGSGGIDDLGPGGATGQEITRRLRTAYTDPVAAAELKDYLNQPAIKAQLVHIRNTASFLDPSLELSKRLLAELAQPGVTDEFKALAGDDFVQRLMRQAVQATLSKGAPSSDVQAALMDLGERLAALEVNSEAAGQLKDLLLPLKLTPPATALAGGFGLPDLLHEAQQPGLTTRFRALAGNVGMERALRAVIAQQAPAQLARYTDIAGRIEMFWFAPYKADAVTFAQQGGLFATGALLGVSFFSIAVGVLLIFLIFVMLAAERRAEMGMSRAVGLKRRHLTQMFLFEGTAYTLGASLLGVLLGIPVGMVMIAVLSSLFSGFYSGLTLQYHVEWTSLVMAGSLGIVLTFVVVAVSAWRVSRLNIVAAIRDLDESEHRDVGLWSMFKAPFKAWWSGLRQLRHGHPLVFLGRVTWGALSAIRTFWWALFRRGPLTIAAGLALIAFSLIAHGEIIYTAGVSLVIIGGGLLIKWLLSVARVRTAVAARAGFTTAAVGLLVYWGRPFGRVEKLLHIEGAVQLDQQVGGPEVFALSALMVLLGAIWLVMYNSDLLIRAVMFCTGRLASLAAVTRTSMSYPLNTKFRTGMAVAMFAIVTFMVVFMSVFKDVLIQNYGQVGAESGGWQIVAGTPDNNYQGNANTVFPAEVAALVKSDSRTSSEVRAAGWESLDRAQLRQVRADGSLGPAQRGRDFATLHLVDDGYLEGSGYAIQPRADGYASSRAVWEAVKDNRGYAVIDASWLDTQSGNPALISGIRAGDQTFQPFQLELSRNPGEQPWRVTVVGFMTRPLWSGIYVSTRTGAASGWFADPLRSVKPTGYYFSVRPGVSVNQARLDIGRLLVSDQVEPVIVSDQVAQGLSTVLTLLNLLTGFLALGLIVGIAGLGVISTRAVVERWQQIGMLRALGFRRSRVQGSFLMESSLIAILGLVIGALVGVWQSYRFFVTDQAFGNVDFHVPVVEILLILVGAYLATLLTTYLPSRAAARVAPAEALRYE